MTELTINNNYLMAASLFCIEPKSMREQLKYVYYINGVLVASNGNIICFINTQNEACIKFAFPLEFIKLVKTLKNKTASLVINVDIENNRLIYNDIIFNLPVINVFDFSAALREEYPHEKIHQFDPELLITFSKASNLLKVGYPIIGHGIPSSVTFQYCDDFFGLIMPLNIKELPQKTNPDFINRLKQ